jgi:hypothetical protein
MAQAPTAMIVLFAVSISFNSFILFTNGLLKDPVTSSTSAFLTVLTRVISRGSFFNKERLKRLHTSKSHPLHAPMLAW